MNTGSGGAYPATPGTFNLNNATFRLRLTDTAQNNPISLSSLRGNAYQRFTITANTTNYNIYSAMSAAPIGWNTTSKGSADVVVNSGVVVGTPSTTTYAMDTGTGWPGPSTIVVLNSGSIVGMGGAGGNGGPSPNPSFSTAGAAGGPALRAQRAMTLTNSGTVGGGGGGGGGGNGRAYTAPIGGNNVPFGNGGGGGGGGRTGNTNSAKGLRGNGGGANPDNGRDGTDGTFAGGGLGGEGGTAGPLDGYSGGNGGSWGAVGVPTPNAKPGGAAGISIQGWTSVTYTAATPTAALLGPTAG
jgi:hypothetical protein